MTEPSRTRHRRRNCRRSHAVIPPSPPEVSCSSPAHSQAQMLQHGGAPAAMKRHHAACDTGARSLTTSLWHYSHPLDPLNARGSPPTSMVVVVVLPVPASRKTNWKTKRVLHNQNLKDESEKSRAKKKLREVATIMARRWKELKSCDIRLMGLMGNYFKALYIKTSLNLIPLRETWLIYLSKLCISGVWSISL